MEAEFTKRLRITGTSQNPVTDMQGVKLEGPSEQVALVEAMLNGLYWITVENGQLVKWRHYESDTKPPSIPDPLLERHWPDGPKEYMHLKEKERAGKYDDPSIYLHHISGYSGIEAYNRRSELLVKAGFNCLRSQRGEDGQVWEVWYLPGAWCAKGPIKGKKRKAIVDWVCKEIRPGNIEVVGEQWGLCCPD